MDFEAEGLLDDLEGEDREARRRLLERLAGEGVAFEELRAAVAEDRLALVPVERVLGGDLSAREVETRTGLPVELQLRMRRLLGLPEADAEDRVFREEDVEAAHAIKLVLDTGLGEEDVFTLSRVLGEAMARLTDATAASFLETFLTQGQTEEDVALLFAELARQLTPAMTPVLVAAYKAHVHESVRRGVLGRAERETAGAATAPELVVCFADLVGFTRLGWQSDPRELGGVAGRLGELAGAVARPPVRLVKTIGDAAMFVSREAEPAVAAVLELLAQAEEAELPALRAGLAAGRALQRGGDFYGHPVNLASRVTGAARPGTVLCTQEVHDAAADAFQWSFAGKHRLKGVSESVALHRARVLPSPESDGDGDRDGGRRARPKVARRS